MVTGEVLGGKGLWKGMNVEIGILNAFWAVYLGFNDFGVHSVVWVIWIYEMIK